jgi:lipopolysaccharide export LptBFGC system permease protein LptF
VPAPNQLEGVLIVDERATESEWLILADHGTFLSSRDGTAFSLRLQEGHIHRVLAGEPDDRYQVARFQSYELKLDPSRFQASLAADESVRSIGALRRQAQDERRETGAVSSDTERALFTAYKDLIFPLATFWLGLLGVPLGLSSGHTGRMSGFAFGVLAIGAYYLVMVGADAVAARGWLPALAAASLPSAILASTAAVLVWRMDRLA